MHLSELLAPDPDLYPLLRTPASLPSVSVLATELQQGDGILLDALYGRLPQLVAEARAIADQVIIDTPPLGEISDALRLWTTWTRSSSWSGPVTRTAWGCRRRLTCSLAPRPDPAGFLVVGGTPGPTSSYYAYGRAAASCSWKRPEAERTSRSAS